jgi:hypothetical protein
MKRRVVDVNVFVMDLVNALSSVADRNIAFRTTLAHEQLMVMLDPLQMGEGLVALIRGACQGFVNGSLVTIGTGFLPVCNPRDAGDETGCVFLSISLKRKSYARGLEEGVQSVLRIVKQHSGSVRISNNRFDEEQLNIYLPIFERNRSAQWYVTEQWNTGLQGTDRRGIA